MENLNTPDCIRTVSGRYVNIFDPKPEMIHIEDIAHSLSMQCRFGGHLPKYYSVAQHSILVANLVPEEHFVSAIMHDASEAYLLDIPTPIKRKLTNYKEIEDNLMKVIAKKYQFEWPLCKEVKEADEIMLVCEWNGLMLGKPSNVPIIPLTQEHAKELFINRCSIFAYNG